MVGTAPEQSRMQVERFTPDDVYWSQCLARLDHDFYHLPSYATVEGTRIGGEARAYVATEGDETLMVVLVVRQIAGSGTYDASSPYGYAGPVLTPGASESFAATARDAIFQQMRADKICATFLRSHPLIPVPESFWNVGTKVLHGQTVWVDLTRSLEEQWRDVRPRLRTQLNKLRREGFKASITSPNSGLLTFVKLYDETMQRVGATEDYVFPMSYYESLAAGLNDQLLLCSVEHDGVIASAGLFVRYGDRVHYHLGGSAAVFIRQSPSRLLLDHVRVWGSDCGLRAYHLGGGLGGRTDSLYRFKAGFSRQRAPFLTWRVVLDQGAYERHVARWELMHGVRADGPEGYFPAYRKPRSN